MPAEEYSPLQQLLLENGLTAVKTLAEICHADRPPLATALLRVFRAEGRETELLKELNAAEVIFTYLFTTSSTASVEAMNVLHIVQSLAILFA